MLIPIITLFSNHLIFDDFFKCKAEVGKTGDLTPPQKKKEKKEELLTAGKSSASVIYVCI